MMKTLLTLLTIILIAPVAKGTTHVVRVWGGYQQFLEPSSPFVVELGDTIQWLPFDEPFTIHTVTSVDIPAEAMTFDYTWQAPADTFFQYVPTVLGLYNYQCTPHAPGMSGSFTVIDGVTSSSDLEHPDLKISLFPNPAADMLSVDLDGTEAGNYTVHLLDHSGRKLDVLFRGVIHSENRTIIEPIGHLSPGIYYILVEAEGYRRARRWVKE